jgi:threonine aldolase
MLGHEEGLFFPSGTMANQVALWVHTTPGTEVLLDANAHIIHWEMAGAAALSGVQVRPVAAGEGRRVCDAEDIARAMRPVSAHAPTASLVCVENTHNGAGGAVSTPAELQAVRDLADEHALPVHMDGARLWNAHVASGTPLAALARHAHTVMVSFSKGLGCPIGAVLVGDAPTLRGAHVVRKRLGGGMRQSGILAGAALHALDVHLARLADDHANARRFAAIVDGAGGARVVSPDTNIVMVDLPAGVPSGAVVGAVAEQGVLLSPWHASRVRAVTHLDVDGDRVERAARVVRDVVARLAAG